MVSKTQTDMKERAREQVTLSIVREAETGAGSGWGGAVTFRVPAHTPWPTSTNQWDLTIL